MDADEIRIANVFGTDEVPEVSEVNLLKYRQYILDRFDKITVLTGRDDFPWEEKYVFWPRNKAEYKRLKKTNPSYKDEYQLLEIVGKETEENDLIAKVKRLSDGKKFELGLSWLTIKNKKAKEYQLLNDFVTWVVNWY